MTEATKKLKCPKCVGLLEEKEYGRAEGNPILLDVCWSCSGIWFDKGELKRALKLKFKIEPVAPIWENPKSDNFPKEHAKCPRCNVDMISFRSGADSRLLKDGCPKCDGTWLDGGELGDLERGGFFHRFLTSIQEWIAERQEARDERERKR